MGVLQRLAACALVGAFAFVLPVQASVKIQKPEFSITLPDGWVEIPRDAMVAMQDEVKRQAPNSNLPRYQYGFQLDSVKEGLAYPYILVQLNTAGRIPEQQFKAMPKIDLNKEAAKHIGDVSSFMSNTNLGQAQYDEVAHLVWITVKTDVVGVGKIQGISGIIPTETGGVGVHAYSTETEFSSHLPVFRQVITSVMIPPDQAYKPRWSDSNPILGAIDWGRVGVKALTGGLIGGVIALVIGLLRRKKRE
jgi:hypothetical protein